MPVLKTKKSPSIISSIFPLPAQPLGKKAETFPASLHIRSLFPFPFPVIILQWPVLKCTPCQGQIKKKGFSYSNQ